MKFPVEFSIGSEVVSLHIITEILAFFIGYRLYVWKKKRVVYPFTSEQRLYILVGAALGALIFSRFVAGLEHPSILLKQTNLLKYFYMNKTVVGGLIGGWLGVEITKKLLKTNRSSGDVMVMPIGIALIIGRIGCFSQGVYEETYGNETTWWTGMDLGDGKLRHPLVLYEMILILLILIGLRWLKSKRDINEGLNFKLFMFAYMFYRFVAEIYKPHEALFLGMNSIQLLIVLTYIFQARLILSLILQPRKTLYVH